MGDIKLVSDDLEFEIPFEKSKEYFFDGEGYEAYQSYIKAIERLIRRDDRYSAYIHKVKSKGFDKCAILGDVSGEKVSIEMHHGPLFTLFDIVDIVLRSLYNKGIETTTGMVADIVLTEHEKDNIQIVMLSKTPHKAVDTNYMFIHTKQSIGRVDRFIERYIDGITKGHASKMEKYIEQCHKYKNSTDNGLFDTGKKLSFKKFKNKKK